MLFCVTLFLVNLLTQSYVPHYIIFHFIFSFYQGTAYLANPSEIPFLISHSRMVILYSVTALDITYLPKLQITWEESIFFCVFDDVLTLWWLHPWFSLFSAFSKMTKEDASKVSQRCFYCTYHYFFFFLIVIPFCIIFLQTFGYSCLPPLFIHHSGLTTQ